MFLLLLTVLSVFTTGFLGETTDLAGSVNPTRSLFIEMPPGADVEVLWKGKPIEMSGEYGMEDTGILWVRERRAAGGEPGVDLRVYLSGAVPAGRIEVQSNERLQISWQPTRTGGVGRVAGTQLAWRASLEWIEPEPSRGGR